ncbi:MAG: hypothetical protein RIS36_1075 [Pseudomonadota bacterium]
MQQHLFNRSACGSGLKGVAAVQAIPVSLPRGKGTLTYWGT